MGLNKAQQDFLAAAVTTPRLYVVGSCGIGKTLVCLELAKTLAILEGPQTTLVVAPPRVARFSWSAEAAKWGYPEPIVLNGAKWPDVVPGRLHTVTYNGLQRLRKDVLKDGRKCPFNFVIFDEVTFCKNPSGKRINPVRRIFDKHCPRILGMTGTPISTGMLDLFAQIRTVCGPSVFGEAFTQWRFKYFYPTDFNQYNWALKPGARQAILDEIKPHYAIFHADEYDDLHIPNIVEHDVDVVMPPSMRRHYGETNRELKKLLRSATDDTVTASVVVQKALQLANGMIIERGEEYFDAAGKVRRDDITHMLDDFKVVAVKKLLKSLGDPNALIICNYRGDQARMAKALGAETSITDDTVNRWNAGKINRIVAHHGSLSHGLNLQGGGRTVIWATPVYSDDVYHQTNSRLARPGPLADAVNVYRLISRDTVEEGVIETLRSRGQGLKALLKTLVEMQRSV